MDAKSMAWHEKWSQEEPGGARRSQEEPEGRLGVPGGGPRKSQKEGQED